jgi:hypothetical protein
LFPIFHQLNNLANVNTPGYRRLDVEFEQALIEELASDPASRTRPLEARIVEEAGLSLRADGNNVDIDQEIQSQRPVVSNLFPDPGDAVRNDAAGDARRVTA